VTNENGEASCNFCKSTHIEEINSYREDHPTNRVPSRQRNDIPQSRSQISSPQASHFTQNIIFFSPIHTFSINGSLIDSNPILRIILSGGNNRYQNFLNEHQGDQQFENLLNLIMQNDPNIYGTPPASGKSIKELKKDKIIESNIEKYEKIECSVCKENYKLEDTISIMPCHHVFHNECLLPWLKQHNSCPVCRYELPTEDKDYEAKKAQIRKEINRNNNNNNNSNNNRSNNNSQSNDRRRYSSANNQQRGHHIHSDPNSTGKK
jgi:hypothetical protein